MADQAVPIVRSKIRRPPNLPGGIDRTRLTDRLRTGFEAGAPVGLLCAPGGSGKSTVLTDHLAGLDGAPVAWLEVDEYDNEPARFWGHLLAAVNASRVDTDPAARSRQGSAPFELVPVGLVRAGDWAKVVERLAAALDRDEPGVATEGAQWLVIDDYHAVTEPVVHEHLDLLIRWLPPTVRLLVSTRLDPPLPSIGRLRLQGRLVELRAADLAFDRHEAARLVDATTDRGLTPEATARLVERTEGWAAGLYLAALTVRAADDPMAAVDRFTGDERLVADYLRSEFIAGLSEEASRFLLLTSVLDELTGDLCDAVLCDEVSCDEEGASALRLRELGQGNLLVVPLDDRGRRFRHHHLIRHWLRSELALTEPELVPELHRRAASWFLEQGRAEPAHRHALASGDPELVEAVVVRFWRAMLRAGRHRTLRTWLDELGTVVDGSGPLCLARAQLARNTGEPADTATRWLDRAAELIDPTDSALMAQLHINRTVHERMIGDLGSAERHGRLALDTAAGRLVPEARALLGATLAQLGRYDDAIGHLRTAIDEVAGETDLLTDLFARSHLALPLYESGQRRQARQVAEEVVGRSAGTELDGSAILGNARCVLGLLAIDDGDLDEADRHLRWASSAADRSRSITARLHTLLGLARLEAATRHTIECKRLLAEARSLVESMPDPGRLAGLVDIATRHYLGRGADGARVGIGPDPAPGPLPLVEDLTERELAVLRLLPSELSLRDVGSELFVSHNTVKGHVKAIYRKLSVNSREQAVARSRELGLL